MIRRFDRFSRKHPHLSLLIMLAALFALWMIAPDDNPTLAVSAHSHKVTS